MELRVERKGWGGRPDFQDGFRNGKSVFGGGTEDGTRGFDIRLAGVQRWLSAKGRIQSAERAVPTSNRTMKVTSLLSA